MERVILFDQNDQSELNRIKETFPERTFPKGARLFHEGDPSDGIYLIVSGLVKVYKLSEDGREKTLALLSGGEILGEMTIVGNNLRSASVSILEETTLIFVPHNKLELFFAEQPQLGMKIIQVLSERLREANNQIESLLFLNSGNRVAFTLIRLAEKYGQKNSESVFIPLRLTQEEIANLVGVSRETVTKVLGHLQAKKILHIKSKQIVIKDLEALKQYLAQ